MIYFHFTSSYSNLTTTSIDSALKKLLEEYSNRSSLKSIGKITSFTGGIYVLKLKSFNADIIFQEKKITHSDEVLTVYFIRGFRSNLQDYVEIRDGKWLAYNELKNIEVENFLKSYDSNMEVKEFKEEPPLNLITWQNDYKLRVEYDIYESEEWIKFGMNSSMDRGMKRDEVKMFCVALQKLILNPLEKTVINKSETFQTCSFIYNSIGVVYSEFNIEGKNIYLLHSGANVKSQLKHWNDINISRFTADKKFETIKDVSTIALKAYPNWALNNLDLWSKIEVNNELGNLSLLPEQTEFLKNFKFPKYINGQAGSGKSTMLYYLFANVYYYKYAGQIPGDIIFLTENERLLEHTKRSVFDLLINNPEFDLSEEPHAIVNVDKHFYPFKSFLLELLPDDNFDFQAEKYLNFSKFKILYEDSNISRHTKSKFSAELVWFTISTYVQGNDLKTPITSSNYVTTMPKEGKDLITIDYLRTMESEIIEPFYNKLLKEGYWDKIKLIKFLAENISINKTYDVIFCDEAQDFSKVELEFIMKLSNYTKFNLSNVDQFPVVFAGDALQTVNPTGFRSEVLTSMIYNELTNVETGYKLDANNLEFTPTYNYRSSQAIVNLANAIQHYRKVAFDADIKNPQISKRPVVFTNENLNVFVDYNLFLTDERLQQKIESKTIIIPVNVDEIEAYKQIYPILEKYKNIISAVDAKGLDFTEVVIFGFGDYFENCQGDYMKRFFYNKLYVAVTRAQAELVIIDSINSKDKFWIPLVEDYIMSAWAKNAEHKISNFNDIIIFDSNEIIQSTPNIIEDDAKRQKEQGIIEKNTALLHVASSHFIKIGNKKEYFICLAIIQEINKRWKKAAEYYLEAGDECIDHAVNAYWMGKHWIEIKNVAQKYINDKNQVRLLIAKLFDEQKLTYSDFKILYEKNSVLRKLIEDLTWRTDIINEFTTQLSLSFDHEEIIIICDILEEICKKTDILAITIIGEKYYSLKKYQSTIDLLEKFNIENKLLLLSKVEISKKKDDYEEIVFWLGRLSLLDNEDTLRISEELIRYYSDNNLIDRSIKNIYINLYAYFSYIIIDPRRIDLLGLAQKVEISFNNREFELGNEYEILLKRGSIDLSIFNFILERWAKKKQESGALIDDINKNYEEIAILYDVPFLQFTHDEIENISTLPTTIGNSDSDHLKNIEIQNFRKFKHIKIENLGLINLIVGDNNIGKTSLLEALLFTPNKRDYLVRLAFAYIERVNLLPDKLKTTDSTILFYDMAKDFVFAYINCFENDDDSKKIEFKLSNKRSFSEFKLIFDRSNINGMSSDLVFNDSDFSILKNLAYNDSVKQPYIAYGKGYSSDLAKIYDTEIRPNREQQKAFLNSLKLFIPTIESVFVNFDGSIEVRDSQYLLDRPLHQYGEGANKLFRILLLLKIHKGKRLLIDEIDAGIHFSRFKEFWRIILKISKEDNTQIIATTHNEECIRFFNDVLNEEDFGNDYQNFSRVIQIKDLGEIKVRSFEFESFNLAFEDGLEIRGGK